MILCPHEKIISKSEADFDTQWRRQMPRDLEDSVATLLPLPNRFVSTEGWRRYDFIIVGGKVKMKLSNRVYDVLKWIALYLLPALGTLYFALAGIWEFP